MPDLNEWHSQVTEEIIDPERRICDPHHHLWDRAGNRYLIDELISDTGSGHNVVSTVFVECLSMHRADGPEAMRPIGETEFVQGVAAMSASGGFGPTRACAGIVSYADLAIGDAAGEVLEAHVAASPNRFRGIRYAAAWHPSPDIRNSHTNPPKDVLMDATFRKGFAHLARLNLSFEGWLYHIQIHQLTDLARAFPDTRIVLDHFGGPLGIGEYEGKADEVFAVWKPQITELSKCPNVFAKLGGINMPINGFGWHNQAVPPGSDEVVAKTQRYYEHTIDCFGPERCMFESNFPVDKASVSYPVVWNAFKKMAGGFREDEKDAMFYGTATKFYRLE